MWSRVQNPEYTGYGFRNGLDSDSDFERTVNPVLSGHFFVISGMGVQRRD